MDPPRLYYERKASDQHDDVISVDAVLRLHLNRSCVAVRRHDLSILKLPGRDTDRYNDRSCDQALGLP